MSVRGRASARAGRPAMRSLGRPPVGRREHRQRFWEAIARGVSSEDAAAEAGVSAAVGVRWFREGGGMRPDSLRPTSGRYPAWTAGSTTNQLSQPKVELPERCRPPPT